MPISKEHFRHEIINISSRYVLIMANSNYPICPERPCTTYATFFENCAIGMLTFYCDIS